VLGASLTRACRPCLTALKGPRALALRGSDRVDPIAASQLSRRFAELAESPYRSLSALAIGFSMHDIDRQRILAVQKVRDFSLAWPAGAWQASSEWNLLSKADVPVLLARRAEGSHEDAEFDAIIDPVGAYQENRWSLRQVPGGKG
jgi:hypothetical protein